MSWSVDDRAGNVWPVMSGMLQRLLRQLVRLDALAPGHTQSRSQHRLVDWRCPQVTDVIDNYRRYDATSDTVAARRYTSQPR